MVLILGSRDGLAWLEARSGLAGLVVTENGEATATRTLEPYLVE